jgi:hypothetical protein
MTAEVQGASHALLSEGAWFDPDRSATPHLARSAKIQKTIREIRHFKGAQKFIFIFMVGPSFAAIPGRDACRMEFADLVLSLRDLRSLGMRGLKHVSKLWAIDIKTLTVIGSWVRERYENSTMSRFMRPAWPLSFYMAIIRHNFNPFKIDKRPNFGVI